MKVITYILVSVDLGESDNILRNLIKIKEVRSASVVSGIYDIVVRVETDDLAELHRVTTHEIHKIPHIARTTSLVVGSELTIPE
jgi:DNA-binding Lrp family transcriptional regulator